VYPHIKSTLQHGVLIYVPSYFDYVRVRNFLRQKQKTDDLVFTQTCEYTSVANISRARSNFYHGKRDILLFTERFHYYNRQVLDSFFLCKLTELNRYFIRGIKHLIFYGLPTFPHFYPEMVNMVPDDGTVLSIFSQFDALQLEPVVGTKRCERLLSSEKATHLFC
jgi:U3 small nucleolar RNA-associated protein 25